MATINLDITIKRRVSTNGNGHAPEVIDQNGALVEHPHYVRETCSFKIDSDDVPLILVESMDSGDFRTMREALMDFLELTAEQSKQLTIGHLNAIGRAMKEAQEVPNA